jgi:hypothetical protein
MVLIGVQLSVLELYLPPVFEGTAPQTIISVPVQTAVCSSLASGTFVVLVAVQLFVVGLYLPPVFRFPIKLLYPPQTIISVPANTAV